MKVGVATMIKAGNCIICVYILVALVGCAPTTVEQKSSFSADGSETHTRISSWNWTGKGLKPPRTESDADLIIPPDARTR